MTAKLIGKSAEDFQAAEQNQKYVFCLYVAGISEKSKRAIVRVRAICEEHLKEKYELEIVDIYQQPHLAKAAQIIAVPTLVRNLPSPVRKFIGDVSNSDRILIAIGVRSEGDLSQ